MPPPDCLQSERGMLHYAGRYNRKTIPTGDAYSFIRLRMRLLGIFILNRNFVIVRRAT